MEPAGIDDCCTWRLGKLKTRDLFDKSMRSKDSRSALSRVTWSAKRCTFSIWYDRLEPTPARMAIAGSANSISRTKFRWLGSSFPQ